MSFEIDFLAVGEGEKGGDAICLRYGDFSNRNNFKVIVIDGGTIDSGKELVQHIKKYYNTNKVDIAFLTHPDCDHASGMREVLEGLNVSNLCMHLPWERAENIKHLFVNNNISTAGLKKYVKENLETAYEVYQIAKRKGIKIYEPFSDQGHYSDFNIKILGPSIEFYEGLLKDFTCTPDSISESILSKIYKSAKDKVTNYLEERWDVETLSDPDDSDSNSGTRPENNSSLIFLLETDDKRFLFTGDAGSTALLKAYLKAGKDYGINLKDVEFIQIPHHGSKRNVGPKILDLLLGETVNEGVQTKTAFLSCPIKDNTKHPSKKVINAFIRRGVKVITTRGSAKNHHSSGLPSREGWSNAAPETFFNRVEDD